jgi:hypothetical protein
MIYKFICFIGAGYLGSRVLYHRTHGGCAPAQLPESVGLVAGGLLVVAAFAAFFAEDNRDRALLALAAALAAVGIGVGVNRVRMAAVVQ